MSQYVSNPLAAGVSALENTGVVSDGPDGATIGTEHVTVDNPGDIVFGTVTANQGDAGVDPWLVSVSDPLPTGTNSIGTVTQNMGAAGGASLVTSSVYEASHVLKGSAGTLLSLVGYNSGPAQFIQLYNSATLPADAVAPAYTFAVPATSNFSLDAPIGIPFTTGIVVGNSSTGPTKTIGGADCYFSAVIK